MEIIFDPSKEYTLYFRCNRDARAMTINFVDTDGNPYTVSDKTWQLNIKRTKNSATNTLQLLSGTGLTIGATSITISPTATQTNIASADYYYELYNVTDKQTWFSGFAKFHDGVFDDASTGDFTVTISPSQQSPRVISTTSTATLTPNITLYDSFEVTAQAAAIIVANPTGSITNFEGFIIRLTDNGTSRAISYGNKFRAFGAALPTATTIGKTIYLTCIYNSTDDVYDTASREEV